MFSNSKIEGYRKNEIQKNFSILALTFFGLSVGKTNIIENNINDKNVEIAKSDQKTDVNSYVPYDIHLSNYNEFKPIYTAEEEGAHYQGGVISENHNENNGTFSFQLDKNYDRVELDAQITANGHFTYYYAHAPFGTPDMAFKDSKENFFLKGTVDKGQTNSNIGSGSVQTLIDKYGSDGYINKTVNWSMSLNSTGDVLTLFINNPEEIGHHSYSVAGQELWKINQIYENTDNSDEYYYDAGDYGWYDNAEWFYNKTPTLDLVGYQLDGYSFENDVINFEATQQNFNQGGQKHVLVNSSGLPYFTNQQTYGDLEQYIIENNIIVSRDGIPADYYEVFFYDEYNNLISKDSYLDTAHVKFKLSATGESEKIMGSTDILNFEIPYINFEISNSTEKNMFETVGNPTIEGHWEFDETNNKWHFKTNTIADLSGTYANGIRNITVLNNGTMILNQNLASSGETSSLQTILDDSNAWKDANTQFKNGTTNINEWFDITLTTDDYYSFNFIYEFKILNNNGIQLEAMYGQDSETDFNFEDELILFDINNSSSYEGESEIFNATQVVNNGFTWTNKSINGKSYKINLETGILELYSSSATTFNEEGLYLLTDIDEYGNIELEIVEYNSSLSSGEESYLVKYDSTNDLYNRNQQYALDQGINDLSVMYYFENRKIT